MPARTRAYLLLIFAVFLWGISGPVGKFTLTYFPTPILLSIRFGLISLIMAILIKSQAKEPFLPTKHRTHTLFSMFILGLFGTIGQIGLIYWGLTYTTSIDATILVSTSPIFVAFASHFLIKEHLTSKKMFGILLGILGSVVIIINPLLETGKLLTGSIFGNLLILAANICWALYAVSSKKLLKVKVSPSLITFWMFFIGFIAMSIISLPFLPQFITTIPQIPISTIYALLFLAIGPGIIAYLSYQNALKVVEPTDADLFNYLAPLFAIPLGFFWLHEPVTISFLIGGAIIALGVFIAEFQGRHRR